MSKFPRCSFSAGAKYFSHLFAPQLSQENTHLLMYKQTLPSKPYCLYVPKHRDMKGCNFALTLGKKGSYP